MKKKLLLLSILIFTGVSVSIIWYFVNTLTYSQAMKKYSGEVFTEYASYYISGIEKYTFLVSEDKKEPYQQNLLVLSNEKLWGLFDFNRYTLVANEKSNIGQIVGIFTLKIDEQQEAVVFYSSNPNKITYYEIQFQENGNFGKFCGGVGQEEAFVIGITGIGSSEYMHRVYDAAIFYDENYNEIEKHGKSIIK